jgi:hypothetical protein
MAPGEAAKLKVCLLGDEGVGKTSLVRRFVLSEFDEAYLRTLGVTIHKRVVYVPVDGTTHAAVLTVWDILGLPDFVDRYLDAYVSNAIGLLAVCDLTRPETLDGLGRWLDRVRAAVGDVPAVVLANKRDLRAHARLAEDDVLAFCELYGLPYEETSAKTGENVAAAFARIAEMAMRRALGRRPAPAVPALVRPTPRVA